MFEVRDSTSVPGGKDAVRTEAVAALEWVRLVEAELRATEATWAELAAAGIDPAVPFAADIVADTDVSAGGSEANGGRQGWEPASVGPPPDLLGEGEESVFAGLPPGVELAGALEANPVKHLSTSQLADSVAEWEKIIAWATARQATAAAELTRRPEMQADNLNGRYVSLHPIPVTAGDLCCVYPWTKPQAQRIVSWAVELLERFPAIHQALAKGRIDERRARVLTDALIDHDPTVARIVEAAVLPFVHRWTVTKVTQIVNRLLAELVPETAKQRHRNARQHRKVWVEPGKDGMAWLHAYLPAEDAQALMTALTAAAETLGAQDDAPDGQSKQHDDDGQSTAGEPHGGGSPSDLGERRTLDQRRADALASWAWWALSTGVSPCGSPLASAHGRPVSVNVTIPLSTLIGLDEHPGELEGYGPIDADVARRLAAAGVWQWVGTDPVGGYALDYGLTRYTPPQELVDFVILRDRECIMPGCHRSAYRCEIDHRVPYPIGPTAACNCSALCKACHLQKHRAGWRIEHLRPGVQRWTSPSGHQHVVELPRIAPDPPAEHHPPPH